MKWTLYVVSSALVLNLNEKPLSLWLRLNFIRHAHVVACIYAKAPTAQRGRQRRGALVGDWRLTREHVRQDEFIGRRRHERCRPQRRSEAYVVQHPARTTRHQRREGLHVDSGQQQHRGRREARR